MLFFISAIILQLNFITSTSIYEPYWKLVWLIGAGIFIAGWSIDEKMEG